MKYEPVQPWDSAIGYDPWSCVVLGWKTNPWNETILEDAPAELGMRIWDKLLLPPGFRRTSTSWIFHQSPSQVLTSFFDLQSVGCLGHSSNAQRSSIQIYCSRADRLRCFFTTPLPTSARGSPRGEDLYDAMEGA